MLLRGPLPETLAGDDQALEVAMAQAMMRRVSRGDAGAMLRVYRPTAPAVAFGRRDVRLPGFDEAVAAVRAAGFSPCVRAPGGRAVAYTRDALVVDHVSPDPEWPSGLERRFEEFGELWTDVLRGFGVDARVGEVPGFEGAAVLRPLLRDVYGALDLPFEDASVGSLSEERPGLDLDVVEDAVLAAYEERFGLTPGDLPEGLLGEAQALLPDHRP